MATPPLRTQPARALRTTGPGRALSCLGLLLSLVGASGCQGLVGTSPSDDDDTTTSPGKDGGKGGKDGGKDAGKNNGGDDGDDDQDGDEDDPLADVGDAGLGEPEPVDPSFVPPRIRRLSNAELSATVNSLLGVTGFAEAFTPDTRQDGFTRNDAQRVDPVFATQLAEAAEKAAAKADVTKLAPCSTSAGSEACARTFLEGFVTRAYRRPTVTREVDALLAVYRVASQGATYAHGIRATVQATLQSPGFLYLTELGADKTSGKLSDYEIANALSYLLTGAPPDATLLASAKAGKLGAAAGRETEARRLLALPATGTQIARVIEEWLGIDRIAESAKDNSVYPEFAGLRDAMKREADSFIQELVWKSDGSVADLLSADWTTAEDALARMYLNGQAPVRTNGKVSLSKVRRRGILNQGAFLSVYAHATETAPVLRGVALLRRITCVDVASPTTLNINVIPPVPDQTKTTRERFTVHSTDKVCASCHKSIDALGFAFENLDGMGKQRSTENGRPVDSTTVVASDFSFDGNYQDSTALIEKMAPSSEVRACFAKHLFRYAAGRSDLDGVEEAFLGAVQDLPAGAQGKLSELLVSFVTSDQFVQRGDK